MWCKDILNSYRASEPQTTRSPISWGCFLYRLFWPPQDLADCNDICLDSLSSCSWSSHLLGRVVQSPQSLEAVTDLQESQCAGRIWLCEKREREDSSWHSRGSISVARSWSTDERNLKFLIVFGWGSSRVTFTLFIRDVSTIWENLLIYVLTRCLGQKLIFALLHISWRVMVIHILFDTKGQLSSVLFSFKSVKEWSAVPISALV